MTYLFSIQGEGRGHLTQALALKEKLESRQHQVAAVIVSSSKELPSFFKEGIGCPVYTLPGPKFAVDKKNQGIKIGKSAWLAFCHLPLYWQSLKKTRAIIKEYSPDVLVSFYEPLLSSYCRLYRARRPLACIGHQYFVSHPASRWPRLGYFTKLAFLFYNWLTAGPASLRIALSFTNSPDVLKKKLFICPPLIRTAIKNRPMTHAPFILIYLLNAGYSAEIIGWCQTHPESRVEAFWDKPEPAHFGNNLVFYPLSGQKFIDRLAACRTYVSTAGFDSIAEAAYLQKNIVMIPTKNHFEQKYNAADAGRAGLAQQAGEFTSSLLIAEQQKNPSPKATRLFREWVDNYDNKIVDLLEKLADRK